jgi:hypothetical protein
MIFWIIFESYSKYLFKFLVRKKKIESFFLEQQIIIKYMLLKKCAIRWTGPSTTVTKDGKFYL